MNSMKMGPETRRPIRENDHAKRASLRSALVVVVAIVLGGACGGAVGATAVEVADAIDEGVAAIIAIASLFGGGIITAVATTIYRKIRPARAVVDLVASVQRARATVKRHAPETLGIVDAVLESSQSPEMQNIVAVTKQRLKELGRMVSVTDD